jgi:hypothetical protein
MNVSALQFGFDIVVDFVGLGPEDDRVESWMKLSLGGPFTIRNSDGTLHGYHPREKWSLSAQLLSLQGKSVAAMIVDVESCIDIQFVSGEVLMAGRDAPLEGWSVEVSDGLRLDGNAGYDPRRFANGRPPSMVPDGKSIFVPPLAISEHGRITDGSEDSES